MCGRFTTYNRAVAEVGFSEKQRIELYIAAVPGSCERAAGARLRPKGPAAPVLPPNHLPPTQTFS